MQLTSAETETTQQRHIWRSDGQVVRALCCKPPCYRFEFIYAFMGYIFTPQKVALRTHELEITQRKPIKSTINKYKGVAIGRETEIYRFWCFENKQTRKYTRDCYVGLDDVYGEVELMIANGMVTIVR